MDIPNLSKYIIYEDGTLWAKNRGMMLEGTMNRASELYYYLSYDDNINHFLRIKKRTLVEIYEKERLLRINAKKN
tara:strand:+ start:345 stop:569 length:225 start_codon:yes stop_codon:yes gene_type:complete